MNSKIRILILNLVMALAYLGCGRLGLLLALDNGYASPIWPPAGLALAAVLLYGRGIFPGLLLGAFLTNSNLALLFQDPLGQLGAHPENIVIAFGNSLQPLVGSWLLRRFAAFPNELCATSEVIRFYLYAGPISCIVAATVGTLSLALAETILPASMASTWVVWWIGDTNGVLILTPVLVSFRYLQSAPRRYLTLSGVLTLALTVTIVFAFQTRNWERLKLTEVLQYQANSIRQLTESCIHENVGALESLAAYLKLAEPVTRDEFESFAAAEFAQGDSVLALSWNPLVLADERQDLEQRMEAAYADHDTIRQMVAGKLQAAPLGERYVPVLYIFPLKENINALGFNVWSDATRREAMVRSALAGDIEATAPIQLVQTQDTGILLFKPVFRDGKLLGYATAVIRVKTLLNHAVSKFPGVGLRFRLLDMTDNGSRTLMAEQTKMTSSNMGLLRPELHHEMSIRLGSRLWGLEVDGDDAFVNQHRDKTAWLLLLSGSLLTGVLGILILTVTGREVLTQRAINERTRELTAANQAKSNFLANMSHEIRTPMNGIIAMTELMMKTEINEEQFKYLEIVRTSSSALLVIINDILDFSKIEAGKLTMENIPFDLLRTVEEVGDLLAEPAHDKGLDFVIIVDHKLPRCVFGDPGRLRQILLNLVNNAIKFTEQGFVILEVMLEEPYPRFLRARFQISDSGIGMSLEHQRNLFRPFFQGDSSMTRKFGGTGLGLAISKQLIDKMGGVINLESSPGSGTCFRVILPLQKDLIGFGRDSISEVPTGTRILVVDSLPANRRAILEHLESVGGQPCEASNARAAKHLIAQRAGNQPIQLVIWDRSLGLEDLPMGLPIIITGPPGLSEATPDHVYLAKPVKRAVLLECIEHALSGRMTRNLRVVPAPVVVSTPVPSDSKILLVEDNRTNQKVATFMLKKLGFSCAIAENGFDALEALTRETYNLVFMDCQMPGLDGFETTRRIRAGSGPNRDVAIVAMTANALKGDRERCLDAGMNDYLSKPVKTNELERVLSLFGLLRLDEA